MKGIFLCWQKKFTICNGKFSYRYDGKSCHLQELEILKLFKYNIIHIIFNDMKNCHFKFFRQHKKNTPMLFWRVTFWHFFFFFFFLHSIDSFSTHFGLAKNGHAQKVVQGCLFERTYELEDCYYLMLFGSNFRPNWQVYN